MTKTNDFNQTLYYLGKVCKYNHVFANTDKSLRQKSNRTCIECQKNTNEKYKKANPLICNERTKRWRKQIALQSKNLPTKKRCNVCFEKKSAKEFYIEKYSANGLLAHCISCDKKRQSDYRANNKNPETWFKSQPLFSLERWNVLTKKLNASRF